MGGDRWSGGDDYELYVGRWSRPVAERFVDWLEVPSGGRWVDVGCGTGALTSTILGRAGPAAVIGVDPSNEFVGHAAAAVRDPRARFEVGSAGALPIDDRWADALVSGLVLNFVPDLGKALHDMIRAGATGAVVAGYVWDYAGEMQLIRRFWDAAAELDASATANDEGVRFPICAPEPLRDAFESAGLEHVIVRSIEVPTVFRDFDDYWAPFLTGVGPAPGYAMALDDGARDRLRERLRTTLPSRGDGSIDLVARAWAVQGRVRSARP